MHLLLRKQAVFKMSNIDGIAKKTKIGYLLKTTKQSIFRIVRNIFLSHTTQDKYVFKAGNGSLDVLQRQKGVFLT